MICICGASIAGPLQRVAIILRARRARRGVALSLRGFTCLLIALLHRAFVAGAFSTELLGFSAPPLLLRDRLYICTVSEKSAPETE